MDLSVNYLGQKLKNPIVIGSSGLTNSVSKIKKLEEAGAGAIILNSLFEEQMDHDCWQTQSKCATDFPDMINYIKTYTEEHSFQEYLTLIKDAKAAVNIPVFASINCRTAGSWTKFAKKIEEAGADGIEINIAYIPCDFDKTSEENEKIYFDVVEKVKKAVNIPISLTMNKYSGSLAKLVNELSWTGNIDSFVLFKKLYHPDIDMDTMKLSNDNIHGSESVSEALRWTMILSNRVRTEIVGNAGVKDGKDILKLIMAGAQSVQVVSPIYKNGEEYISTMLNQMEQWMREKGYDSLNDVRGLLRKNQDIKKGFGRVQFMKYYESKS
ncbi:MAG: dihydroorotate dehydrogenase-like protein [Ichthyobacteriaceae bacterium]|nr:dihydroorotate dehydrogenase-like protein [Ichthyobacteriaceae bacterium]